MIKHLMRIPVKNPSFVISNNNSSSIIAQNTMRKTVLKDLLNVKIFCVAVLGNIGPVETFISPSGRVWLKFNTLTHFF